MTKYEIKKVFSKKSSKIAIIILLFVMGITCFFAMDVEYVDENGHSQSGISEVAKLRAAQKEWAGLLDEDKIRSVIAENLKIENTPEALSQDVTQSNIAYGWKQGIDGIRDLLNRSYAKGFREYDYYRADSLTEDDAPYFYENRILLLKEWLYSDEAKYLYTEAEKEYLINQYTALETPFYYDYIVGWQQLFEYTPTIIMLTMLIVSYLVAGIFSNEFTWKSDALFFSSIYGRNKAVSAKVKAGFCIVTVIYFVAYLLYTGIVLLYLGADGFNLPVQVNAYSWKCFYNITNIQKYFVILFGGYIGCLFFSFLTMFVSAKTKSTVLAVTVPVILLFIPSFTSNIKSPVISKILGLLPDKMLDINIAFGYFNLYNIGGKIFGEVPVIITLYTILTIILIPALYYVYKRTQIN